MTVMHRPWKYVTGHDGDWVVIYNGFGMKVWEGHECNSNALIAIFNQVNVRLLFFEFTDENEIDGCTPDDFANIKGIKQL